MSTRLTMADFVAAEPRGYMGQGLAKSRVYHLDALQLLGKLDPNSVGTIITDPPYFISFNRAAGWSEARGIGVDPWIPDLSTTDAMIDWSLPLAQEALRVLRPGGAICVMGGAHSISAWQVAADRVGLVWMAEIIVLWNTGKPRLRNFGSLTTTIRWHAKPGSRHVFNSGDKRSIYSNVIICDKVPVHERLNPTQKPVELTNFLVSLLTADGDTVVDPFCGAGSTLVSAAICDRPFIGGDIDPEQCRLAESRLRMLVHEEGSLRPLSLWSNGSMYEVEG